MESFSNPLLQHIATSNGNDKCVECGEAFPKWVSFPSAVFICSKCARAHKNFTKPQKILSIEVAQFTEHDIKLLSIGGNNRFLSLMKEYSVSITEPNIEYKYLTVISAFHSSIIEAEVNKLEGVPGALEKYQKLLSARPIYEIGGEINTMNEVKDEGEAPVQNEHEAVKSDMKNVASTVGGWFGYFTNAVTNTAKMVGIDQTLSNAKKKVGDTMTYYGVDSFVKTTSSAVYNTAKVAGGFLVEKGKEITEIPVVKGAVNTVEHSYVSLKEKAGELIGVQSKNEQPRVDINQHETANVVDVLKDDSLSKKPNNI